MKRVIINEDVLNSDKLAKTAMIDELPDDIKDDLYKNKTSLGKNPLLPDGMEEEFLSNITLKRFEEAKENLSDLGEIESESVDINHVLGEVTKKCQEIEKPIRTNLEKIIYNILIDLFCPPEGVINVTVNLVDEISNTDMSVRVQSEDSDFDFDDMNQKISLSKEVYKRRFIDAIIMGAALRYSSDVSNYVSYIYKLNRELPKLYEQMMKMNDYNIFAQGNVEITDDKKYQIGLNNVIIGNSDTRTEVEANAITFPVLLCESIRAFMEVFAAHGLPKKREEAMYVMNKADFLQAEQWDMRIGPALWDCFTECLGEFDTKIIPYVFAKYCALPFGKFNSLTNEILIKSKKAKRILNSFKKEAQKERDYSNFKIRMKKADDKISVINDGYIHPNEL